MSAKQIRTAAWESLKGKYGTALLIALIGYAIISAASMSYPFGMLLVGPVTVGLAFAFLKLSRDITQDVKDVFFGFESCFVNSFLLSLLTSLFTFLWTLLFIVPGIIKYLSYSMAPYLMADNPEATALESINESKRIMMGHKGRLFCLYLSFIGWFLLACFTFGIGFILLMPYVEAAKAEFFKSVISAMDTQEPDVSEKKDEESNSAYL